MANFELIDKDILLVKRLGLNGDHFRSIANRTQRAILVEKVTLYRPKIVPARKRK